MATGHGGRFHWEMVVFFLYLEATRNPLSLHPGQGFWHVTLWGASTPTFIRTWRVVEGTCGQDKYQPRVLDLTDRRTLQIRQV